MTRAESYKPCEAFISITYVTAPFTRQRLAVHCVRCLLTSLTILHFPSGSSAQQSWVQQSNAQASLITVALRC